MGGLIDKEMKQACERQMVRSKLKIQSVRTWVVYTCHTTCVDSLGFAYHPFPF